uniref:Ribosomal protein L6 alpha-beta domain-containing protein n=1 Tax=Solanum lycopersicum TaxID=4081 RepID=K4DD63_SOLLC
MDIPNRITTKVKAKLIEIEGPRGKLNHLNLDFHSRKATAAIRTTFSHVKNLIIGVTKGYWYKMCLVYAHFPINSSVTDRNKSIEICEFLGDMLDGVTVVPSKKVKDELVLYRDDIELGWYLCNREGKNC